MIEDGGTEDEAIAGLLHDAVEDGEGRKTLEEIRQQFGDGVADIVWECSNTDAKPKPPWKERKTRYVEHLRQADLSTRRVSCADKLHNARSILFDFRTVGDALWERFNVGRDEQLWYYRALVKAFREAGGGRMVEELHRVVEEIARESGSDGAKPKGGSEVRETER